MVDWKRLEHGKMSTTVGRDTFVTNLQCILIECALSKLKRVCFVEGRLRHSIHVMEAIEGTVCCLCSLKVPVHT